MIYKKKITNKLNLEINNLLTTYVFAVDPNFITLLIFPVVYLFNIKLLEGYCI